MNSGTEKFRLVDPPLSVEETPLSLQVIDGKSLNGWTLPQSTSRGHRGSCLVCIVSLGDPKIRSTLARKARLKDSLEAGSASQNAAILAKDAHFWDYLQQINLTAYDAEIDASRARLFINRVCGVQGRRDLDRDPLTSQRFFTLIQQPFLNWLFP